ncbi:MAG: DUF1905 domain-containing protein, partial [Caldilineaceae bacterium]|nr:DUF1905 domain-containing protein [Caldilineaceae bacterium]
MEQQFEAIIQQSGKRVLLRLPFDPDQTWGRKERHDVTGTVNGIKIRGPLLLENEQHFLALGPAWRRNSGLDAGTKVT